MPVPTDDVLLLVVVWLSLPGCIPSLYITYNLGVDLHGDSIFWVLDITQVITFGLVGPRAAVVVDVVNAVVNCDMAV